MLNQAPLTIWCNAAYPAPQADALARRVAPHRLVWSDSTQKSNLASVGPENQARSADILYGQPHPEDLIHSTSLKWVQLTTAGYSRYDNDSIRSALRLGGAIMTNSSSVFADPCAEHVLAFMLCAARNLAPAILNDATAHAWPYLELRYTSRLLRGQSAVIVGMGAIGHRLIQLLAPFEMMLSGVRRTVRGDEPIPTVPSAKLDELLPAADHVINLLPSAAGNIRLFNADRISCMKRGALFYNVGRGDTVDQDALCDALDSGQLAGAYLDVTTPEPLPPAHRLWRVPNCYITPHSAGGHDTEFDRLIAHFINNLRRFEINQPLIDRIM
jgi:phosphoglycerate dehydrogenase-like enzyme